VSAEWIRSVKPEARSLSELYRPGPQRREIYAEMVEQILEAVRGGASVCALFYGHPGVYVAPSHQAVGRARAEGFEARMLPGISSEDCLFADLGVDPADRGWQSFEATDFLLRGYEPDPAAALVLWQVDALGKLDSSPEQEPGSLRILAERLRELYPGEHQLVFYLASSYPIAPPTIERIRLEELGELTAAPAPTLYVAPARWRSIDPDRARALGLTIP
jgi:tetrapyrrole (corrin/porphyrin) methylase-like protein